MNDLASVDLSTIDFQQALHRYMEDTKPDPLARKQVEGWSLEWKDQVLQISTSTAILSIFPHVEWTWDEKGKRGSMDFNLKASAKFLTKSQLKSQKNAESESKDRKEERASQKILAGMVNRLRKDDYIQKLLVEEKEPPSICTATIMIEHNSELEERVHIQDDIMEAIRRLIFSQAESPISVVEFLVSLPYLSMNPLGHRIKLRLLEDAMVDECDREGENELLDELNLNETRGTEGDDSDSEGETPKPKRKKR